MRKNRQAASHYRYVYPGSGSNASLLSWSHCVQFLPAHLMAGRDFLTQFLAVIGFTNSETLRHEQHHRGSP